MLTLRTFRRFSVGILVTMTMMVPTSASPSFASTKDAVNACGATSVKSESAYVPQANRKSVFLRLSTGHGDVRRMCGNGTNWGAVHVELQHEVPNWGEASTCIARTIGRGSEVEGDNGKTKYSANINGVKMRAVRGNNGLVTAFPRYPKGTNIARKWRTCGGS